MKISTGNLKSVRTTVVSCWAVVQHMSTTPHAALVLVCSSLGTFTADITKAYSIHVYPLFKCFFKGRVSKRSELRRKAKLAKLELVSVPTSLYYTGPPTKGDRACELQVRSLLQRSGPEFLLAFGLSLDITEGQHRGIHKARAAYPADPALDTLAVNFNTRCSACDAEAIEPFQKQAARRPADAAGCIGGGLACRVPRSRHWLPAVTSQAYCDCNDYIYYI